MGAADGVQDRQLAASLVPCRLRHRNGPGGYLACAVAGRVAGWLAGWVVTWLVTWLALLLIKTDGASIIASSRHELLKAKKHCQF